MTCFRLSGFLINRDLITHDPNIPQIAAAKVLCVGAGGIGCELLKTLVCTGFKDIQVVRAMDRDPDLDSCRPKYDQEQSAFGMSETSTKVMSLRV